MKEEERKREHDRLKKRKKLVLYLKQKLRNVQVPLVYFHRFLPYIGLNFRVEASYFPGGGAYEVSEH